MPKVDYYEYLASREWRLKRKEVIELSGGLCQRCASHSIEDVHHLTYKNLGNETIDDLIGVCRPCHEYLAGERDEDPALEVIQDVINKGGLRPDSWWPKIPDMTAEFYCGEFEHDLIMILVPNARQMLDDFKGLPKQLITPDMTAVFYWEFNNESET